MLCLGHAFVSAAPFANADRIVRIVCVADRNQPLVVARLKLSEPEGESPLLSHTTELLPVQQIVYSHETMSQRRCSMDDQEFLRLFHDGNLPGEEFRHKGHLRLAWLVLSRYPTDEASTIVAREIRRFAGANGASNRYHDTLTRFWVRLVGHAMANAPEARSIAELLARFPFLLERGLPFKHWRGETLNSGQGRACWVWPGFLSVTWNWRKLGVGCGGFFLLGLGWGGEV